MNPLRVLSYNIHKGFTMGKKRFVLEMIRQAIRETGADLVFLQEVLGEHAGHRERYDNWPEASQFEYLADKIWPHFAYGRNAVYSLGHHGNAILSRHPILSWENIDISTNRVEQRGLLHATIGIEHGRSSRDGSQRGRSPSDGNPRGELRPLHAICVHLGLLEAERFRQIHMICDRIESHVPHAEPLIVAGDFNDWMLRASGPFERRLEVREAFLDLHGAHARTFPSWLPALRLDRVYYRGLRPTGARCLTGSPWRELSDHNPIYVEMH